MAKYQIHPNEKEPAAYTNTIPKKRIQELKPKIKEIIVKKKRYLVEDYKIGQLAKELNTNTRYVAAAIKLGYGMNFPSFVNKCRVEASLKYLQKLKELNLNVQDIAGLVGFKHRQPFYAAFYKNFQITPRQYLQLYLRMTKEKKARETEQ